MPDNRDEEPKGPPEGDPQGAPDGDRVSRPADEGVDHARPLGPAESGDDEHKTVVVEPGSMQGLQVPVGRETPLIGTDALGNQVLEGNTRKNGFDPTGDVSATEVIPAVGGPSSESRTSQTQVPQGYEVMGKIGEGSTGAVYKARQVAMDRIVSLKILSDELSADEEFVRRFVREARASGQLNHPNIVRAFDVGKSGKQYYFVREFVDGGTLAEKLSIRGKLPAAEAVEIASQVGRGLYIAHQSGLVHRDVTPANILISSDGTAKLANFGMAKNVHLQGAAHITSSGKVAGTPDYVSPEQAQGVKVDPRSDIYSLGITLYEMLTGRLPYAGDTPAAVLAARIQTRPRLANEVDSSVPPGLARVVDRMMATSPEGRPANLQVALKELQSASLKAPPPAQQAAAVAAVKRRPKGAVRKMVAERQQRGIVQSAVIGGVAVVALIIGALVLTSGRRESLPDVERGGSSLPAPEPTKPLAPVIDPLVELEQEAAGFYGVAKHTFEDGNYDEVVKDIDAKGARFAATTYGPKLTELRTRAADALEEARRKADEDRVERQYKQLIGVARSKLGRREYKGAQKALEDAQKLKRTEEIGQLMREAKRGEHLELARQAERNGSIPTAIVHYRAALEFRDDPKLRRRIDKLARDEKLARLLSDGRKAEKLGDLLTAVARFESALEIADDPTLREHVKELRRDLDIATAIAAGKKAEEEERYGVAIKHYERALAMKPDTALAARVKALGEKHRYASIIAEARAAEKKGDWPRAAERYEKALSYAPGEDRKELTESILRAKTEIAYGAAMKKAREAVGVASWSSAKKYAREALRLKPKDEAAVSLYKKAFDAAGPDKFFKNSIGMEFVLVPAGEFIVGRDEGGDEDERPSRTVTLPAFYMSVSEVTNAQFEEYEPLRHSERSEFSDMDRSPIVDVSWREAAEFCRWLSKKEGYAYRLPNEQEWEKAARGTDGRTYPWGDEKPAAGRDYRCNFAQGKSKDSWKKDGFGFAAPVGKFGRGDSPYGCQDMAGNVWEWCTTTGPGPEVVLRGGSFSNNASAVRATNRAVVRSGFRAPNAGFRVLREVLDWEAALELLEKTR